MKVILTSDVKGKGKKGEVKEFQAGYANFLVKSGLAKVASEVNMNELKVQKEKEAEQEALLLQAMKDLKVLIESSPVTILVKVAKDGHVLGTVTSKHIAEGIEKNVGQKVDKRKITFTTAVVIPGDYTAKIQLHKEVVANIKIIVKIA